MAEMRKTVDATIAIEDEKSVIETGTDATGTGREDTIEEKRGTATTEIGSEAATSTTGIRQEEVGDIRSFDSRVEGSTFRTEWS